MLKKISLLLVAVAMLFGGVNFLSNTDSNVVQAHQPIESMCASLGGPTVFRVTSSVWMRAGAPGQTGHNINVHQLAANNNVTHAAGNNLVQSWRRVTRALSNGNVHGWIPNNLLVAVTC